MSFEKVHRLEANPGTITRNPFGDTIVLAKIMLDSGAGVEPSYVGHFEYAQGAADSAIRRSEEETAASLQVVTQDFRRPTGVEPIHFVCTDQQVESVLPVWHAWAGSERPQTQVPIGFLPGMAGNDMIPGSENVATWWGMSDDIIWTRSAGIAENIRQSFVNFRTVASGIIDAQKQTS
jgi:hypothetical protein